MADKGTWQIEIGGETFADLTDITNPEPQSGGPEIMTVEGYGAAQPTWQNMGNLSAAWPFTMTRQHDTDTDAWSYFLSAVGDWAGVATVILTHTDYEGDETQWQITNAKITVEVMPPIGLTSVTKITFFGNPVEL